MRSCSSRSRRSSRCCRRSSRVGRRRRLRGSFRSPWSPRSRGLGDRLGPGADRRGCGGRPVGDPRRPDDGPPRAGGRRSVCSGTSLPRPRRLRRRAPRSPRRRVRCRRVVRRAVARRAVARCAVARRDGGLTGRGRGCFAVPRSFAVRRGLDDRVDQACLAQTLGSFDPHRLRDLLQLREELPLQRAAVHGVHRCPASLPVPWLVVSLGLLVLELPPVGEESLQSGVGQWMLHELREDVVRHRGDVRAGERCIHHVHGMTE